MFGFSLFGVNLSGAEYDPGGTLEGTNYTYPTDAEIDYYASKGMTVIRLPFLLERVEPVPGGPLSTTELGYIITSLTMPPQRASMLSWTRTITATNTVP
jgi:endoglucanase